MAHELIPGLEGIPIAESKVSFVDGQKGRLEYRGISVEDLAENSTFEETAFLLMYGHLPTQGEFAEFNAEFARVFRLKYQLVDLIKRLPEAGHPMDALQAGVAAIGMFYQPRSNLTEAQRRLACTRIFAKTPCVVAAFQRLRHGEEWPLPLKHLGLAANFLYMMTDIEPDPEAARVLDVCLILHADHTMNASTFAGRVVGSTLADPYCVVSSALGALSGPLHGGANEDAMSLFEAIGKPENARPYIEDMIKNKKKIPGFGHRVYKTIDPRAKILKKHAAKLAKKSGNPIYEIAVEAEKVVTEHYAAKGIWPNVDFFSGIVYSELGIPRDCFTPIFAIARVAGWLGHLLEQLEGNRIFRPTQIYTGQHDQPYVSINER